MYSVYDFSIEKLSQEILLNTPKGMPLNFLIPSESEIFSHWQTRISSNDFPKLGMSLLWPDADQTTVTKD